MTNIMAITNSLLNLETYNPNLATGVPDKASNVGYVNPYGGGLSLNPVDNRIADPAKAFAGKAIGIEDDLSRFSYDVNQDNAANAQAINAGVDTGKGTVGKVAGVMGKIGSAATLLGGGSPLSLIGLGINAVAGVGKIIQAGITAKRAKESEPQQIKRTADIVAPDLRVTGQERAAQEAVRDVGYASTVRQSRLLGKDATAAANANLVSQEIQYGAANAAVNRQAAAVEAQYDQANFQKDIQQDAMQDQADAFHAQQVQQVRTQAFNAIPQTVLDLGQSAVSLGNFNQSASLINQQNMKNAYLDAESNNSLPAFFRAYPDAREQLGL